MQRPAGWANQKVLYDAKRRTHTAQGISVSTLHGDLLWCDGGWPGGCHEHELLEVSGIGEVLDATCVVALVDRGFRGMARARKHWYAPVGDRRTKDRLTDAERDHNHLQAGLRALVEQSISHLGNAWALRRWRGLPRRVRDVYRAAAALISLAAGFTGCRAESIALAIEGGLIRAADLGGPDESGMRIRGICCRLGPNGPPAALLSGVGELGEVGEVVEQILALVGC